MKTIDLRTAALQPLTAEEEKQLSGGIWLRLLGGAGAMIASEIIGDWDNFKRGLMGLPEK